MRLTFWGAAEQVTGSMFLLELEGGYKVLIDCGLDLERGPKAKNPEDRRFFPFQASEIDAVLLTHAHIDHSGNLPNLYAAGFNGPIYCTEPTIELTALLLQDSAAINRKRAEAGSRSRKKGNRPSPEMQEHRPAFFADPEVIALMQNFEAVDFNQAVRLTDNARAYFIPAGHLLGAAGIVVETEEDGIQKRIAFSGDTGRENYPLLNDPGVLPEVDYLVCESTYGNRFHSETASPEDEIERVIRESCVDVPGRLIIPAFSVGRTQALLFIMNKLRKAGRLPDLRIFADSPLAIESTKSYEKMLPFLNREAQEFHRENGSIFDFDNLTYVENVRESRELSDYSEPCVLISASGMMDGGRILHHVRQNLQNPYCTILMVGYAAEGTLGSRLINGASSVSIGQKEISVRAAIRSTDAFSGHGDRNDLLRFVTGQKPEKLQKIFLVHGEPDSMREFSEDLSLRGYRNIRIPKRGESFEL